jgi:uncharacterized protein (PEP-CTERM system associated)
LAGDSQSSIYGLMSDLLAVGTPDPAERADAVRGRLESTGAIQYAPAEAGFLTSEVTIAEQQEASFTLLGRRNTLAFVGTYSEFATLGPGTLGLADTTATATLEQWTYSASWSYRLSGGSSVTLADSHLQARDLTSDATSRQHSLTASLLKALDSRTLLTASVRRFKFKSDISTAFTENAVVFTASMRF